MLFRNREVKHFLLLCTLIATAGIIVGFIIDISAGILAIALSVAFCAAFFIFTVKRYRDIAAISERIDRLLHGDDSFVIESCEEGELSILQSEISKMTVRLREHSQALKNDKLFLSDSMADIAHQLRTPLTSINIIVSFMRKPGLAEEERIRLTRELETLMSRIDWLISSLLKISKIDAGTAVFEKKRINVRQAVEKALAPLMIPLELRDIRVTVDGDTDACFIGDFGWTAEAIGNVIKNCMEHVAAGGEISIKFSENVIFTEIEIKDNGSGIEPDDLPHIFERFYQGKHTKGGSFGVGLALCRTILSAQNATIKASNHKSGACFTIRFYHHTITSAHNKQ